MDNNEYEQDSNNRNYLLQETMDSEQERPGDRQRAMAKLRLLAPILQYSIETNQSAQEILQRFILVLGELRIQIEKCKRQGMREQQQKVVMLQKCFQIINRQERPPSQSNFGGQRRISQPNRVNFTYGTPPSQSNFGGQRSIPQPNQVKFTYGTPPSQSNFGGQRRTYNSAKWPFEIGRQQR